MLGALVPRAGGVRGAWTRAPTTTRTCWGTRSRSSSTSSSSPPTPSRSSARRAAAVRAALAEPLADELTRAQRAVLAALLHDMAKPATHAVTPEGRVTFIGHDRLGAEMADDLMRRLRTSARLREFVARWCAGTCRWASWCTARRSRCARSTATCAPRRPPEVEIIVLSVADRLATRGPRTARSAIDRHLALAREVMDAHFRLVDRGPVRPLVAGDELAEALGARPVRGSPSSWTRCARSSWWGSCAPASRRSVRPALGGRDFGRGARPSGMSGKLDLIVCL